MTRRRSTPPATHQTSRAAVSFPFVTRPQLALVFRKDTRTVARWLEEGLPVARRGHGGRPSMYSLPACIEWVIARELAGAVTDPAAAQTINPNLEKALLDRSKRQAVDFQLQVKRGDYVRIADAQAEFAEIAATVKTRLRAIPDALAPQVQAVASSGPAAVKALLLQAIDSALRGLVRAHREAEAGQTESDADDEIDEVLA